MGPELGVLCASEHRVDAAFGFVREAAHASLFLMHTGVKALADARLSSLLDDGVDVTVCAMNAEAHGFAPREGGPRFGSQYDHAALVREVRRFVALTPRAIVDNAKLDGSRSVRVRVGCDPRAPEVHQALRSALAYAALDLDVSVAVEPEAEALLGGEDHSREIVRALATLRALGKTIQRAGDGAHGGIEVRW